jgi:hypothetical protein
MTLAVLVGVPLASAHGMITAVSGNAGGKGIGLGVSSASSDDLGDVTVFKGDGFGSTGVWQDSSLA